MSAITARAPVNVPDFYTALLVNGHVEEVEQVPTDIGPASCPYTTALHRSIRRGVGGRPSRSSIEGVGNVKVPNAIEGAGVSISGCRRAVEGNSGAVGVLCHGCGIPNVFQSVDGPNIGDVVPCHTMIVGSGDDGRAVVTGYNKVDAPVIVDANRRVTGAGDGRNRGRLNVPNGPGDSVVF